MHFLASVFSIEELSLLSMLDTLDDVCLPCRVTLQSCLTQIHTRPKIKIWTKSFANIFQQI